MTTPSATSVHAASDAAPSSAAPAPAVRLHRFSDDRGTGIMTTRAVARGEILFVDSPCAWFQPRSNAALAPCCAHGPCMRTLGSVEQLADAAAAVYAHATAAAAAAAAGSKQPQQQPVSSAQGSTEDRARKTAAIQRILDASAPQPGFVLCRSDGECEAQYCSASCEAAAWASGHAVLCVGSNPALQSFFSSRNVARNADLHVAAQMMGGFVALLCNAMSQQQSKDSDDAASAAIAEQLWAQHTMFHALPWSLVLAVQAVQQQQQGATSVPLRVVAAVNASITARDAAEAKEAGLVSTIGEASAAESAASAPAVDPCDRALFGALSASQMQYRAALAEPFALLRAALLSTPASPASRCVSHWSRFISLPAFDLLAGANRLNCTMTQCAMAMPSAATMALMQPLQKARKLTEADLTAGGSDDEDGSSAAAPAFAAATSSGVPFLVCSLESLFLPLGLPLSCSRGLFALHSKMNHACSSSADSASAGAGSDAASTAGSANARVENWQESEQIRWSAASVARATQRAAQTQTQHQSSAAAASSSASSGSGNSANAKKKQQKARKAAANRAARLEQESREELEQLEELAVRAEKQSVVTPAAAAAAASSPSAASTAASSSSASSAAAAPASSFPAPLAAVPSYQHSSQIVVRALRSLSAGEEVLIDYLPSSSSSASGAVLSSQERKEYLRTHYLFECRCSRCNTAGGKASM